MARKTNKTAHVLNLLSGNTNQKSNKSDDIPEEKEVKSPTVSNIKMDSVDKEDAVSDIIHQQLLSELSDLIEQDTPEPVAFNPELTIEQDEPPTPISELTLTEETTLSSEPSLVEETIQTDSTPKEGHSLAESPVPNEEPTPAETSSQKEEPATTEAAVPTKDSDSKAETAQKEESLPEKEPDFVVLNLMEQIVQEKIIYYMRQFEVCTCDRCVADTIALTLNGLQPKYLVTPPAAIPPLVSFYTNKYISDITVEATKACQVVKDHPRH